MLIGEFCIQLPSDMKTTTTTTTQHSVPISTTKSSTTAEANSDLTLGETHSFSNNRPGPVHMDEFSATPTLPPAEKAPAPASTTPHELIYSTGNLQTAPIRSLISSKAPVHLRYPSDDRYRGCRCVKSIPYTLKPSLKAEIKIYPPSIFCQRTEIILKRNNVERCVSPDSRFGGMILKEVPAEK
ncbi:uncharacterized protein [Antennarius striatus]